MEYSSKFWSDKQVILTGGSGFLGSYLVKELTNHGIKKIIVPRKKEFDLRDVRAIQRLFTESGLSIKNKPENDTNKVKTIVIHLAATVGGIGLNQLQPATLFYDNLIMGTQLLHESWRMGVTKFVAVGTVCAYPKYTEVPFQEEKLWEGYPEETNAPYGLAKKMLLVQSQAYRKQYGFNSIYLLPANLYGPGDNFDPSSSHVIPSLISKFINNQFNKTNNEVEIWGTGKATREFLYVKDAARGIRMATELYNDSSPINLGSETEISIKDLAKLISTLTKFKGELNWDTTKPDGQPRRSLNTDKAKTYFGFKAATPLKHGLISTIEWYKQKKISSDNRF